VLVGGAPHILSYMTRLQVGKEKLDCDFSQLKLHHVPFEITYMSNVTRLNLDDNKLKDLWPVAPLPPFTGGPNHTRSSFSTSSYSILFGSSMQRNARLAVHSLWEEQILARFNASIEDASAHFLARMDDARGGIFQQRGHFPDVK
jgi:hypothetical protein